jgi:hypothetical protein
MSTVAAAVMFLVAMAAAAATERPALVVQAADSPVRIERAVILAASEGPPVILYSAINATDAEVDTFTVMAFVFDEQGTLKARQTAPARRTLDPRGTKHSTMVLDGNPVGPTDFVVIGVNQSQRSESDAWWRTDLQEAAVAEIKKALAATAK